MRLVLLALLVMICAAPLSAGSEPKVDVVPWPSPTVQTFDPQRPPSDLTNPRGAEATATVNADGVQISGNWDGSTLAITGITSVRLHGGTRVRVPRGKTILTQHELGHDTLFRWCFEQHAQTIFENALKGLPSKYRAATSDEALTRATADVKRAIDKALSALMARMNAVSDTFDELTKHGTSPTISAEKAIELVRSPAKR